jgi:tetratricopeptide (TPR) repeat protein
LHDASEIGEVEHLLAELGARGHDETELLGIRVREHLLRFEFEDALEKAREWDRAEPFHYGPSSLITYLQCVYRADFEDAVKYGAARLKRQPKNEMLANNVAYALANLGRTSAAQRLLPNAAEDPTQMATLGLILLKEGRYEEGAATYEKAVALARQLKRPSLADAIAVKKSVSLLAAGDEDEREFVSAFESEDPTDFRLRLLQVEASRLDR